MVLNSQIDRSLRWSLVAWALALLHSLPMVALAQHERPADHSQRHALLIGVTHYPNLGDRYQLQGPANDVELIQQLLTTVLDFSKKNIVALTETQGKNHANRLPTRANIDRELARLVKRTEPGDHVVLFLAGHGSQQPASSDPENRELDGLDEIFLPRDVGKWNGAAGRVEGAITDNQIARWVDEIRQRDGFVWLIVDSCHAGTLLRSADERVRQVSAEAADGLNIPRELLANAKSDRQQQPNDSSSKVPAPFSARRVVNRDGVAAIYACQPDEVTVERVMPRSSDHAKHHGLLTFTLCKVVHRAIQSGRQITHKELASSIRREYAAMGRRFPSPFVEGSDGDRELFGQRTKTGQTNIVLISPTRINAGALHGLTENSILEVISPAAPADPLGHVELFEVNALTSEFEPCAFAGMPAPDNLPEGVTFRPVYIDLGDARLNIAVDRVDRDGVRLSAEVRQQLGARIREMEGTDLPARIVEESQRADWLIRPGEREVVLVRASESVGGSDKQDATHFGPIPSDDRFTVEFARSVRKIARAENLKKLAASGGERWMARRDAVSLEIDLRRRESRDDLSGKFAIDWKQAAVRLYDGDRISIHVQNPNRFAVDLNLFYIDSDYAITAIYPIDGEFNRLAQSQAASIRCTLSASSGGMESLIVIGVRSEGERVDLSGLAQAGLRSVSENARSLEPKPNNSKTPLMNMLRSAMNPVGSTRSRGVRRAEVHNYGMELITWQILDTRRPQAN